LPAPLPTIILVHPREKRSKCSVEPLRGDDRFLFRTFPEPIPESLENYFRLGFGGPLISESDNDQGLLILDGTWKLAGRMENVYCDVPIRSLPECQTAYPRTSKLYKDPLGGLATIEAVYLAYKLLGRDTTGLLKSYRWASGFLEANDFEHDGLNSATSDSSHQ
jgi:pre-rRNA-processing protein TSR3